MKDVKIGEGDKLLFGKKGDRVREPSSLLLMKKKRKGGNQENGRKQRAGQKDPKPTVWK